MIKMLSIAMLAFGVMTASSAYCQQPAESPQLSLLRCNKLLQPTQMHGTAVVGNRIYIFGGNVLPKGQPVEKV